MQHSIGFVGLFAILALIGSAAGRDQRNVTEPKTPASCTSLTATGGDDTEVIQKALDSCTKGKAVALSSGTFYSGPLVIPSGVSLLVDEGVTLKALTDPKMYDLGANTCGTLDDAGVGCKAFITMIGAVSSGIYGKGVIDGQGNVTMVGKDQSWWELAHEALLEDNYHNTPWLIQINASYDITLYQITLLNSPHFTIFCSESFGFTVWGTTILAPPSARNTDAIDPNGSQNVTIAYNYVSVGDDNVAIKSFNAPSRYISVYNNHFVHGNGMSIGSEVGHGASSVTVWNITLNGTKNGIHVKSNKFRGGHVSRVSFTNICVINAETPFRIDMNYMNLTGPNNPEFHDISFTNIRAPQRARHIFHGLSPSNPVYVRFNDVHVAKGSVYEISDAVMHGSIIEDASGDHCGYTGNYDD
uniref:Glycoside hydrolase family 28 n=1 Tax=Sipyloidea sipylus TaxID=202427 RepID=A0A191XT59_SIPSI|nr:glycoside hydrolase family 28 [Sipyloidea sipylus]